MDNAFVPAMDAAYAGDTQAFRAAIEADPSLAVRASSQSHPSLLQFVAVEGGLGKLPDAAGAAAVLIACGAPLDAPFVAAASVGATELIDQFLCAGVHVDANAPWTALEEALYWGHAETAQQLLRHGAHVSSLRAASALGDLDAMQRCFGPDGELLATAGPVLSPWGEPRDKGDTQAPQAVLDQALLGAVTHGQLGAAAELVRRGASVHHQPIGRHVRATPLHFAVEAQQLAMVEWLLEHGADPRACDASHGQSAIGWARHFGHEALALRLEEAAAAGPT